MQEEVENRTVALIVSGSKFSGHLLQTAISKYLAHRKSKHQRKNDPVIPHGKQSIRQLTRQNAGVSNIELKDPSIREFERIARKYGVDYAVRKDRSSDAPKYTIFFKGRDADALNAALTEYSAKKIRQSERPSVIAALQQMKSQIKNAVVDRSRRKEPER